MVAQTLISKAIGGDINAIREVADRIDGKVAQAVTMAGEEGTEPVVVVIRQMVRPDGSPLVV